MPETKEKTNPSPVQSETERAISDLVTYSVNSYVKNCGLRATKCAESDLLGEALKAIENALSWEMRTVDVLDRFARVRRKEARGFVAHDREAEAESRKIDEEKAAARELLAKAGKE